jgi:hypothetical protein
MYCQRLHSLLHLHVLAMHDCLSLHEPKMTKPENGYNHTARRSPKMARGSRKTRQCPNDPTNSTAKTATRVSRHKITNGHPTRAPSQRRRSSTTPRPYVARARPWASQSTQPLAAAATTMTPAAGSIPACRHPPARPLRPAPGPRPPRRLTAPWFPATMAIAIVRRRGTRWRRRRRESTAGGRGATGPGRRQRGCSRSCAQCCPR